MSLPGSPKPPAAASAGGGEEEKPGLRGVVGKRPIRNEDDARDSMDETDEVPSKKVHTDWSLFFGIVFLLATPTCPQHASAKAMLGPAPDFDEERAARRHFYKAMQAGMLGRGSTLTTSNGCGCTVPCPEARGAPEVRGA